MEEGQSNLISTPSFLKNRFTKTYYRDRQCGGLKVGLSNLTDPVAVGQTIKDCVWNSRPSLISFRQNLGRVEDFVDLTKAFPEGALTHATGGQY